MKAELLIICVRVSIIDAVSVVLLQRPFGGKHTSSQTPMPVLQAFLLSEAFLVCLNY